MRHQRRPGQLHFDRICNATIHSIICSQGTHYT
jgi:hypothetical protein